MLRMREDPGLKDGGEIRGGHFIHIGLCRKHGEQVEDIQQELAVERRQGLDLVLIYAHCGVRIESTNRWILPFNGANRFGLVVPQRLTEGVIMLQRNNGLGEVVKVATQDVGGIVHRVACPVEAFAVAWRGIECSLELLDSLFRAGQSEDAFDIGGCGALAWCRQTVERTGPFSLRYTPHLATTIGT